MRERGEPRKTHIHIKGDFTRLGEDLMGERVLGLGAADLEALLESRSVEARPPGLVRRLRKWVRRRPVHATVMATMLVATIAASIFLMVRTWNPT